ncbi:PRC-barrel domain containing protein [Microbacterium bovistercoris]|uniref:PRC-barrel domain containing protein n=1 Tax=Microbacterium bovistercoris TaxID=2293570 RepID=A0A371NV30_9MICO|nr:PRC-barrel domain-containing protein [Microbacterium bovistercoris]REJ06315.1 PRC-barrel domain containing protein [Microbacterium bovistercoris]
MNAKTSGTLFKLSETDETVRQPDEDIRGRDVRDRDGEDLGTVKDLLIDADEDRVRFLEVASGGFLGIGKDTTLIPVDAITSITADEVRIDQTREHVAGAPAYDPELVRRQEDYGSILEYYGYMPFWGGGYVYPGYPYHR